MVGLAKFDVGLAGATVALAARVEHAPTRRLDCIQDRLVGSNEDLGAIVKDDSEGLILHGRSIPHEKACPADRSCMARTATSTEVSSGVW